MFEGKSSKEIQTFITQTIIAFVITFVVLLLFGFLPKEMRFGSSDKPSVVYDQNLPSGSVTTGYDTQGVSYTRERNSFRNTTSVDDVPLVTTATKPIHISIPQAGVNTTIVHPTSPRVDVLDEALKKGAVYYPGSGTIEQGNIFLFGHSSNWAIVQNQAYKTFNNLEKLRVGDEIYLTANGKQYVYSVETVTLVDANTAFVDLSKSGRRLTISTCNTFGKQSERWVVDAVFKEVRG